MVQPGFMVDDEDRVRITSLVPGFGHLLEVIVGV